MPRFRLISILAAVGAACALAAVLLPASRRAGLEFTVGRFYDGQGDEFNARRWYALAAAHGIPRAEDSLGRILVAEPEGLDHDPARAASLFRAAANAGDPGGMCDWGLALFVGLGGPRDPVRGLRWIRAAALRGDRRADKVLADCYAHGLGIVPDASRARRRRAEAGAAPRVGLRRN